MKPLGRKHWCQAKLLTQRCQIYYVANEAFKVESNNARPNLRRRASLALQWF